MALRKTNVSAKPIDFDREMAEINAETDVFQAEMRAAKYSSRSLGNSMRRAELEGELESIRQHERNAYYLFLAAKKKHLDLQLASFFEWDKQKTAQSNAS
jgi:hypothetical protein